MKWLLSKRAVAQLPVAAQADEATAAARAHRQRRLLDDDLARADVARCHQVSGMFWVK